MKILDEPLQSDSIDHNEQPTMIEKGSVSTKLDKGDGGETETIK
ncbi:hypothetical protein QR98_0065960, partial [Sarcoptes scabiei]